MDNQSSQPVNKTSTTAMMWVIFVVVLIVACLGIYLWWQSGMTNTNMNTVVNTNKSNQNVDVVANSSSSTNSTDDSLTITNSLSKPDWRHLVDEVTSYSIQYPNRYTPIRDPVKKEKVILEDDDLWPVIIWAIPSSSNELPAEWWDAEPIGDITMEGISGKKFIYQICDGPSCSPDIVTYMVVHNSIVYAVEFYGDNTVDTTEQEILDSFTLPR